MLAAIFLGGGRRSRIVTAPRRSSLALTCWRPCRPATRWRTAHFCGVIPGHRHPRGSPISARPATLVIPMVSAFG